MKRGVRRIEARGSEVPVGSWLETIGAADVRYIGGGVGAAGLPCPIRRRRSGGGGNEGAGRQGMAGASTNRLRARHCCSGRDDREGKGGTEVAHMVRVRSEHAKTTQAERSVAESGQGESPNAGAGVARFS